MANSIEKIESLANGSKLSRLLHNPAKYCSGIFFKSWTYPKTKKGKLVATKTFFGVPIQLLLPAGMDIYLLGAKTHDSEIRLTKYLMNTLKAGDQFIDVGAHFGFYSLLAAHKVGNEGTVHSFEASPNIYKIYKKNTASFKNIHKNNLACNRESATLTFFEFPILYSEYNTINPDQYNSEPWMKDNPPQKITIDSVSLDEYCAKNKVNPNFIKIDVEGAELTVLEGATNLLNDNDITLSLEYLLNDQTHDTYNKATRLLAKYNYKPHQINDAGQLESVTAERIEKSLVSRGIDSDNIIFKK